jgi:hypothetical protein
MQMFGLPGHIIRSATAARHVGETADIGKHLAKPAAGNVAILPAKGTRYRKIRSQRASLFETKKSPLESRTL